MILTDESPMPFGIHKGTAMINIDADYLLYLYYENLGYRTYGSMSDVMVYVNDNIEILKRESKKYKK